MHLSFYRLPPPRLTGFYSRLLILQLCLLATAPLSAGEPYLAPGQPDGVALLPPAPAPGSEEEKADLTSTRSVFDGRTPAEEKRAFKDATLAFSIFKPAIGDVFRLEALPKTSALLQKVKKEIGSVIDIPKDHFKRVRPYKLDPHLSLRDPEPSFSYPSGHSTRGTVYSLLLAELFPEKRDAILQVGREIGWDRVLIGKHYPTDVYAGRVLGKSIVRELQASAVFRRDLADARAEIEAAAQPVLAAPTEQR